MFSKKTKESINKLEQFNEYDREGNWGGGGGGQYIGMHLLIEAEMKEYFNFNGNFPGMS